MSATTYPITDLATFRRITEDIARELRQRDGLRRLEGLMGELGYAAACDPGFYAGQHVSNQARDVVNNYESGEYLTMAADVQILLDLIEVASRHNPPDQAEPQAV
jgi:hypothetical protein